MTGSVCPEFRRSSVFLIDSPLGSWVMTTFLGRIVFSICPWFTVLILEKCRIVKGEVSVGMRLRNWQVEWLSSSYPHAKLEENPQDQCDTRLFCSCKSWEDYFREFSEVERVGVKGMSCFFRQNLQRVVRIIEKFYSNNQSCSCILCRLSTLTGEVRRT